MASSIIDQILILAFYKKVAIGTWNTTKFHLKKLMAVMFGKQGHLLFLSFVIQYSWFIICCLCRPLPFGGYCLVLPRCSQVVLSRLISQVGNSIKECVCVWGGGGCRQSCKWVAFKGWSMLMGLLGLLAKIGAHAADKGDSGKEGRG